MKINLDDLYLAASPFCKTNIDEHISVQATFNTVYVYIDNVKVMEWYIFCRNNATYYYKIPDKAIKIINQWSKDTIKQREMKAKSKKQHIQNHINNLY